MLPISHGEKCRIGGNVNMNDFRKKILVLGAGRDQVPIIKKAQEMGFYVIAVSPKGDFDGLKIANAVFYAT